MARLNEVDAEWTEFPFGGNRVESVVVESDVIVACSIIYFSIEVLQCSCSGWPTGKRKKLSRTQAQLSKETCLAVA